MLHAIAINMAAQTFDNNNEEITMIWTIVIGIIAGWLAGLIMKGDGYGLIWDLILGIAGAVVGSWLFGLLGLSASGGLIGSIVVATVGAIFLIFLSRALRKG
jgi:uncharacterized membrane protein YeaQ/YmgE (transglycosylase-associated protein family)